MNYTTRTNTWNSNIYRPEGNDRSAAVKPVTKPEQPMKTENITLAELIALATKRSGLRSK
jgi:hypothetical protein